MINCVKYIVFRSRVLLMIVEWILQHVQTELKTKKQNKTKQKQNKTKQKQNKTKKKKNQKKTADWPKILKYVIPV